MDPKTLTAIKLKQCSRMLLSKQGFLIDDMVKEGLMSYESAEEVRNCFVNISLY
jgi:polyhydroxyalkanoate synthesis regulator phasin